MDVKLRRKLEIALCSYAPYKLEWQYWISENDNTVREMTPSDIRSIVYSDQMKPILRPLSDLDKKIEVNGEQIVPIRVILEEFEISTLKDDKVWAKYVEDHLTDMSLPYCWIQKLFEYHFDVFRLIPEGLAVDINTLNK